jgi:hypothetical protein
LSPNGKHVLLQLLNRIKVYNTESGELNSITISANFTPVKSQTYFSREGSLVLFMNKVKSLSVCRLVVLGDGKPDVVVPAFSDAESERRFRNEYYAWFTPKGHLVRFAGSSSPQSLQIYMANLRIYSIDADGTAKLIRSVDLPLSFIASSPPQFSNDEKRVVLQGTMHGFGRPRADERDLPPLLVFDTEPPRLLCTFDSQKDGSFVSFSPDGKRAITHNKESSIGLWDVAQKRKLPTLKTLAWCNKPASGARRIVISPDWTRVAMWEASGKENPASDKNDDGLFYWSIPAPLDLGEGE